MRRSFALALASLSLGVGSILIAGQGCTRTALGVQDLCGWLADECNCYRRFAAGVAPSTKGQGPMCGVQLDANKNAINPATNMLYPAAEKPTIGTFLSRDKLDVCVLTGAQGGQIVFDPPLDPLAFPPSNFAFKILDGTGKLCGDGSYATSTSFSIGFPAPEGTGGTAGTGGSGGGGGTGGTGGGGLTCRGDSGANNEDPAREAITYGTFSIAAADPTNVVETTCPNDEKHRFNLLQLDKCDGSGSNDGVTEESYRALMPTAQVDANAGGISIPGEVRLRITWPKSEPVDTMNGQKPIQVEYFDCLFPGSVPPCLNGVQDGAEVAVDCGFVACGGGCPVGSPCTQEKDCTSGICTPNVKGLKECVATPCGDGKKSGAETCDDGNMQSGDGCSADCAAEPGYRCNGEGPGSCVDIDECIEMTDNCDASAKCKNTKGSFTCACDPGFSGDGVSCKAGCGDGTLVAPEACDDKNTATMDGCDANCVIEPGFTCMGAGPMSCVDIDECATNKDNCNDKETCKNTKGSFQCACDQMLTKVCSGVCIDIGADTFNCGDCAKVCNPGQACMNGVCTP
jgi:cysteine-rich repeat protein